MLNSQDLLGGNCFKFENKSSVGKVGTEDKFEHKSLLGPVFLSTHVCQMSSGGV